jgi:hypothetical protein
MSVTNAFIELDNKSLNVIETFDYSNCIQILINHLDNRDLGFKYSKMEPFLFFLYDNIKHNFSDENLENLIYLCYHINKSHTIINKIHKTYGFTKDDENIHIMFNCACFTTYKTVCNILKITDFGPYVYLTASNSDDRIFYDCLSKIKEQTELDKTLTLRELFKSPEKYALRKLKKFGEKFNLESHWNIMLDLTRKHKIIKNIIKYYKKEKILLKYNITCVNARKLIKCMLTDATFLDQYFDKEEIEIIIGRSGLCIAFCIDIIKHYDIQNFTEFIIFPTHENKCDICDRDIKQCYMIFNDNCNFEIDHIDRSNINIHYLIHYLYPKYGRIIGTRNQYQEISWNKFYFLLKCYIRKKLKKIEIKKRIPFNLVMDELITFKPNKHIKILNNGSTSYNLIQQKFSDKDISELQIDDFYDLDDTILIKIIFDGVTVNNLPSDKFNTKIKAEWIEDHDLYLVSDIDEQKLIIERQEIIGNILDTEFNTNVITDFITFQKNIQLYLDKLIKIIKNTEDIKIFSVGCFIINKTVLKNIIDMTLVKNNKNIFKNELISIHGFEIQSLDGLIHKTLKTKDNLTIDLLFNGIDFIDNNKNKYKVDFYSKPSKNSIVRCNRLIGIWKIKCLVWDKIKPYNINMIKNIQSTIDLDWSNLSK